MSTHVCLIKQLFAITRHSVVWPRNNKHTQGGLGKAAGTGDEWWMGCDDNEIQLRVNLLS